MSEMFMPILALLEFLEFLNPIPYMETAVKVFAVIFAGILTLAIFILAPKGKIITPLIIIIGIIAIIYLWYFWGGIL